VVRLYTNESVTSKQASLLSTRGREIFLDTFSHIVPFGNFYKKPEAISIVRKEVKDTTSKWKMLRLLELIPKKKSLHLAQKEINERNSEKIIDMFGKINLSPVTISKRHGVGSLENLYTFLMDDKYAPIIKT
jgi:hypothetical protein